MPYRCCVPYCRGNYEANGPRVTIFSFPLDPELRKRWLGTIKRKNFVPTKSSRVCELHFRPNLIERKATFKIEATGEVLESPLKIPRLVKGAVPTKMLVRPSNMLKDDIPTQISPECESLRMEHQDVEKASATYNESITFTNMVEAFDKLTDPGCGWVKGKGKQNICFFFINELQNDLAPKLSVFLSEELSLKVFFANNEVKKILCTDESVLKFPLRVTDIITLKSVLSELKVSLLDDFQENSSDT